MNSVEFKMILLNLRKYALSGLISIFCFHLFILKNDTNLEWLLDDSHLGGFHWRPGMKRDTAGIWIWGEPIMIEAANGETYAVVLVS